MRGELMATGARDETSGRPSLKRIKLELEDRGTEQLDKEQEAYYSANFKYILHYVLNQGKEGHVISASDRVIIDNFERVDGPGQQLFVRFFLRKHKWLRLDKQSYTDIADDLSPLVGQLVSAGLLLNEMHISDVRLALDLLLTPELKSVCKDLRLPSSAKSKHQCIAALLKYCRQQGTLSPALSSTLALLKRCKSIIGSCVKVSPACTEAFSKVLLLFLLMTTEANIDDDTGPRRLIYRMLQVKIGKRRYPQYSINITRPLFGTKEDFDRYYSAHVLEQRVVVLLESKTIDEVELDSVSRGSLDLLQSELSRYGVPIDVAMGTVAEASTGVIDLTGSPEQENQPIDISTISKEDGTEIANQCNRIIIEDVPESSFLIRYTAGWVCVHTLSYCVDGYEKLRQYRRAVRMLETLLSQRLYGSARSRGRWWERLALDLDSHLHDRTRCLGAIKTALDDPLLPLSSRLSLTQRARKICTVSSKSTASRYPVSDFPVPAIIEAPEVTLIGLMHPQTCLFVIKERSSDGDCNDDTVSLVSVECYAIHHYTTVEAWPRAIHAEGGSFSVVYVLLMWDTIYGVGVPDVFRGEFQTMPLDFGTPSFYKSRQEEIDRRLSWIDGATEEELACVMERQWESHYEEVCVGINWDLFPGGCEDVKNLVACLKCRGLLTRLCRIFSEDYGGNRGGVPDLTLWDPMAKTCKFVEVKGPGDRLSHKQVIWLSRLLEWGGQAEVCRVKAVRD